MRHLPPHLIVDFDGTLINSGRGIFWSLRQTFMQLGKTYPGDAQLTWTIGPGVDQVFRRLFPDEPESYVKECVRLYRVAYDNEGFKLTDLYPRVEEFLSQMESRGGGRFLVTMKAKTGAEKIIELFSLQRRFNGILCNVPFTGIARKTDLVKKALQEFSLDPNTTAIIGDTVHDVEAGKDCGLVTVAVLHGYGTEFDLRRAAPDYVCADLGAVISLL